jgi:heat shock protein HslJ
MGIRWGVVLTLLVLAGCGERGAPASPRSSGGAAPELDSTSWIATSVTDGGTPRPLAAGSTLRVDFSDGTISINAGCNHISGRYTLSGDELSTHSLASTDMGCEQALMDQDAWLTGTVFASPLTAHLDGDTLTLSRPGLQVVLRDRHVVSPDAPLQGTAWQLDGLREGSAVSSLPQGVRIPTLRIAADGTVRLHTGCNSGGSDATIHGSVIALGPVVTTKMACADPAGQQLESAVLQVLTGDVSWSISEQTLTLTRGEHGLVYRAAR